jgi:hypothetical protein
MKYCEQQCSGSVTFWYGSGWDPYLRLTDPDADPAPDPDADPDLFVRDLHFKTPTKNIFKIVFMLFPFGRFLYIILQR